MTWFWVAIAIMLLAAIAFIAWPLWRRRNAEPVDAQQAQNRALLRDQLNELQSDLERGTLSAQQFEIARKEIAQRALEELTPPDATSSVPAPAQASRGLALALALVLPLAAIGVYLSLGNPRALHPQAVTAPSLKPEDLTPEKLAAMLQKLEEHLKNKPDDVRGWSVLARSNLALGRMPESLQAYAKAVALTPQDAELLTDYTEALMAAGDAASLTEAKQVVARALQLEPEQQKALAIAGALAYGERNFADAIVHWNKLLQQLPRTSEFAQQVSARIEEARKLQATPNVAISGTVRLSEKLKAKLEGKETLFIFAKAVNGPPMPLAVLKAEASSLPTEFRLDDAMAMAPGMRLSSFERVEVNARISKAGSATSQSGDLVGRSQTVKPGAAGVEVLIDEVVP